MCGDSSNMARRTRVRSAPAREISRSPWARLPTFLIKTTVDTYMPVFALIALVAYSTSLALIIPGLLQKNSGWRRMAILSAVIALVSHAFALESRIIPGDGSVQNLSVLNVGSLVSLMICSVMTIVASKNRGWLLLPIVYAFALINLAFATFVPNEYITHLETTPGMMVHIGLSLFAYATLIIAALYAMQLAWIDYQLKVDTHQRQGAHCLITLCIDHDIMPGITLRCCLL
jgi:ABC-type uncharacterized transport system permease subunit